MSGAIAWLAPLSAVIGLGVAAFLGSWVLKQDPGNAKMQEISKATQEGAMAFLKAEWKVLIIFAAVVYFIPCWLLSKYSYSLERQLTPKR